MFLSALKETVIAIGLLSGALVVPTYLAFVIRHAIKK